MASILHPTPHLSEFDRYLARWRLSPDGVPVGTRSSLLLPVRHQGQPAMLKIAVVEEEKAGGALMAWWNGRGSARVLAHDAEAVLLERAEAGASLVGMAQDGRDEEATRIICDVVAELHGPRPTPPPGLVPLLAWFKELETVAASHGSLFATAWTTAQELLARPRQVGVLHGDIHHANILDFGPRGWLAIDPKGLWGECGFDYANLFRNPDAAVALRPGRFDRQVALVCKRAGLEPARLLRWVVAVMGLSAAWHVADEEPPGTTLTIAGMAAAALGLPPG